MKKGVVCYIFLNTFLILFVIENISCADDQGEAQGHITLFCKSKISDFGSKQGIQRILHGTDFPIKDSPVLRKMREDIGYQNDSDNYANVPFSYRVIEKIKKIACSLNSDQGLDIDSLLQDSDFFEIVRAADFFEITDCVVEDCPHDIESCYLVQWKKLLEAYLHQQYIPWCQRRKREQIFFKGQIGKIYAQMGIDLPYDFAKQVLKKAIVVPDKLCERKACSVSDIIDNGDRISDYYFENEIDLPRSSLTSLNGIHRLNQETITSLDLSENKIEMLPPGVFARMRQLKSLNLSSNRITELVPDIFLGLSCLESLYFYGNRITELSPEIFQELVNLEVLFFHRNQIKELSPEIFQGLVNLRVLSFGNNHIKELPPELFKGLRKLQKLDLSGNLNIGEESLSLRELYFGGNHIKELPPELFRELTNLRELNISNTKITRSSAIRIREVLPEGTNLCWSNRSFNRSPQALAMMSCSMVLWLIGLFSGDKDIQFLVGITALHLQIFCLLCFVYHEYQSRSLPDNRG